MGARPPKKTSSRGHRERQDAKIEESVERVIGEFVSQGRIEERVFDEGVRKLLQRRSGRVANMALEEFASLEGREAFDNPAAYLTKIVCRISAEENPFEKFATKHVSPRSSLQDGWRTKRERSPSVEAVPESAEVVLNAKERRRLKRAKLQKDQEASTHLRGAGVSSGTWNILSNDLRSDGCDARGVRDTVGEAPLGPFRATRAQHEKQRESSEEL